MSTYIRVNHLRQTIEALKKNSLAIESTVYIFSDGPRPGHEEQVEAVRHYLKGVNGFKKLEIVESPVNAYPNNLRQGMRDLLSRYGKMISFEEDVVTAPSFLNFMNYALDKYEGDRRIFSIAGYCPPFPLPESYPYDVFFVPRFNPWGFGIWKDRFEKIEMNIPWKVMNEIFLNPRNLYNFSRVGLDVLPLTLNNYFKYVNGLDSKIFSQQFVMGMLTIYPVKHLVDNIGLDGSGIHKKKKHWYRVGLSMDPFKIPTLPAQTEPNPDIMKAFYNFRSGGIFNRIKILLLCAMIITKYFLMPYRRVN